jgi:hypothetical protein
MGEKKEKIDHPDHYNKNGIEVIDIIMAYELGFCLGNVLKYVLRAKFKGHKLEDLKKAKWYLQYYIKYLERGEDSE